jgi:hypothetical protein
LTTERADQRQRRSTKKHVAAGAPKVTRSERREEYSGGVEANLTSAVQLATWKRARKQILAQAKRLKITQPDAVAELVGEWVEADPDRAMGYVIADAEQWVRDELRRNAA